MDKEHVIQADSTWLPCLASAAIIVNRLENTNNLAKEILKTQLAAWAKAEDDYALSSGKLYLLDKNAEK